MAEATPSMRKLVALGPIKMEIVHFDASSTDFDITSGDYFYTLIQRPLFAMGSETEEANTNNMTCAVDATLKKVTVTQTGLSTDSAVILVFGF